MVLHCVWALILAGIVSDLLLELMEGTWRSAPNILLQALPTWGSFSSNDCRRITVITVLFTVAFSPLAWCLSHIKMPSVVFSHIIVSEVEGIAHNGSIYYYEHIWHFWNCQRKLTAPVAYNFFLHLLALDIKTPVDMGTCRDKHRVPYQWASFVKAKEKEQYLMYM